MDKLFQLPPIFCLVQLLCLITFNRVKYPSPGGLFIEEFSCGSYARAASASCGCFCSDMYLEWFVSLVKDEKVGASLVVQWLRIRLPSAGDMDLSPGSGRFHLLQDPWAQLQSLCSQTVTSELVCCNCWRLWTTTREAIVRRNPCTATREQPPLAATRESLHAATKTQCSQK